MTTLQSIRSNLILTLIFVSFLFATQVSAAPSDEACAGAVHIEVGQTSRSQTLEQAVLAVEVPEPGILALEASVLTPAQPSPKLGFLGRACATSEASGDYAVIERTAAHRVIALRRPGTFFFRVAAEDPAVSLGELKVAARFAAADVDALFDKDLADDEVDPDPKDLADDEVDPDPKGPAGPKDLADDEVDPDPKDLADDEVDPDPKGSARAFLATLELDELCRGDERDDHGDTFLCATRIAPGRSLVGEIDNGWGDDADVFQLRVAESGTIYIEAAADLETYAELYDRSGQRLARVLGDGSGFRLVKTVVPGRYFLRVAGLEQQEGAYALSVQARDW